MICGRPHNELAPVSGNVSGSGGDCGESRVPIGQNIPGLTYVEKSLPICSSLLPLDLKWIICKLLASWKLNLPLFTPELFTHWVTLHSLKAASW